MHVLCRLYQLLPFAAQTIKETLDKKLGGPWHVVAGTSFSYDVTHKVCPKQCLASQMMACLFIIAIHFATSICQHYRGMRCPQSWLECVIHFAISS